MPQSGALLSPDRVPPNPRPFAGVLRYDDAELPGLDSAALSEVVEALRAWAGDLVG
jgi:hypothetical protein